MRTRLRSGGMIVPDPPSALGHYLPARRSGALVFTAGQLPLSNGELQSSGLVGQDGLSVEDARQCARTAALNALAAASTVCDLDTICAVVKVTGYVASAEGFVEQPAVIDGASEVMLCALGEQGKHAREAVGVRGLPKDAPVEVSVVFEVAL